MLRGLFSGCYAVTPPFLPNYGILDCHSRYSYTTTNTHEICKKIKEEKPDVFFIDYVQNLYLNDYTVSRNRTQEVGRISRMMRETAVANNAISVLGSQLSRKVDDRENKRPRNSDLRDSGELEQDADVIMLLYRDEYYYGEKSEKQGILEIAISKNREGATGYAEFIWSPETSRIEEVWMGGLCYNSGHDDKIEA